MDRVYLDKTELYAIALGSVLIAAAVTVAVATRPTGYELSMYTGQMVVFWVLLSVAAVVAIVLGVYGQTTGGRTAGMVLTWVVSAIITILPVLRSYYFFGRYDALNHLGLVKDMLAGLSANDTIYPGIHLLVSAIVEATSLDPRTALMLVPTLFVLLFALGCAAIAKRFGGGSLGTRFAGMVVVTMPFLIAVRLPKLQGLPTVVALLMFPFLIYLILASSSGPEGFIIAILMVAAAHVFYHPQHALLLAVGMMIANVVVWVRDGDESMTPRFGIPIFIGVILLVWLTAKPEFNGALRRVVLGVQSDVGVVEGATPAGTSLSEVGGSVPEIAAKVLGPTVLLLSGLLLMVLFCYRRFDSRTLPSNRLLYILVFVGTSSIFIPLFAVSLARSQMFRYVAVATIFCIIAGILYLSQWNRGRWPNSVSHGLAILLIVATITSFPVMYKSGYVYQPNDHVPESEVDAYNFVFDHQHEEPFRTVNTGPFRYRNAIYGKHQSISRARINHRFTGYITENLTQRNLGSTNGTFVVTGYAKKRYVDLYGGLAYSSADFEYVERGPGIHKIYTNGDTNVYSGSRNENKTVARPGD